MVRITKKIITFTKVKLPYGWLGNMSPHTVIIGPTTFKTAEHAFQAGRLGFKHSALDDLLTIASPLGFKIAIAKYRDEFIIRPCSEADLSLMGTILLNKFRQHDDLKRKLIETGKSTIIEDVTKRKNKGAAMFWGAAQTSPAKWEGQNNLGKILMSVRDYYQAEEKWL